MTPTLPQRLWAEFLGTFWLVFGGCGSAVLAATFVTDAQFQAGIGFLGVALAFGLTVVTGAYALGHISGGHFNPAVTLGLWVAKRIETAAVAPTSWPRSSARPSPAASCSSSRPGAPGFDAVGSGFATNGYGELSPGGYSMLAVFLTEVVLTAVFLWVILGVTSTKAPKGFAPLAIGLSLTLIHLVSIPVSNTSVNPARSLGVAWFAGAAPLSQVWLFIVAPILGAVVAGLSYAALTGDKGDAFDAEDVRVATRA